MAIRSCDLGIHSRKPFAVAKRVSVVALPLLHPLKSWSSHQSQGGSAAHVSLLDALIRAETEIPMLMTWPHSAPAVICLDPVSKVSELRWRPGSKRRSAMPTSSWR